MSEVKVRTKRDSVDEANLAETLDSPGFALIRERLVAQRKQYVEALVVAKCWDEARFLQGQIAAVDRSLEVPSILRQEMKRKNA